MPMNTVSRRTALIGSGAAASAWGHEEPVRMGLHGMALVGGRDGLYASHLPMFHSPHDVQLLLRIRLGNPALDAKLRAELVKRPELWTLVPERFDLSRLHAGSANLMRQFSAQLVQGHFERGGQERESQVLVEIERLMLFNRLLPEPRRAAAQRFFWFGQGREQFLVKWLDQRPDVDLLGRFVNRRPLQSQRLLTLPAGPLAAPDGRRLMRALREAGAEPLGSPAWIYTETGDLA